MIDEPWPPVAVYRVELHKDGAASVRPITIGVDMFKQHEYASANDLPGWVQERVATLMTMPIATYLPRPGYEHGVKGVGVRVKDNVFWIDYP